MAIVGCECCPYCEGQVRPKTDVPFGQVCCETCGRRVWFLTVRGRLTFFRWSEAGFVRELFHAIAEQQRVPEGLGMDGFDVLELVVGFEEALLGAVE